MVKRIQLKLVVILVLLVVTVMTLVGAYVLTSVGWFYEDSFRAQVRDVFRAELMSELRAAAPSNNAATRMREILAAYAGSLGISEERKFYILNGKTGECMTGSDETAVSVEITRNVMSALSAETIGSGNDLMEPYFDTAIPVTNGEFRYIIYIRDDKSNVNQLLWMLFSITVQAMLFGLIISILLSFLLAKTISKPVENLKNGVDRIADGEFAADIPVYSRDEIGALTKSFNSMAHILRDTISAVEKERNKLSTLFLHMSDGVAAFDAGGEVLHINPAAETMLGIGFDTRLRYDDVMSITGVTLETAMGAVQPSHVEADYVNAENGRNLKFYIAAFGHENGDGGVIAIIHDVTEQTRMDESRREFIANVSHELRTPLTNVKSYSETIFDSIADGGLDEDTEKHFLTVILGEVDRMTRIVKDLLTLSRMDNGKMDWKPQKYQIRDQLEHIYSAMKIDAEQHSHKLILELPQELPEIVGDRERIEQVLVNIVSNAVKYTPDGGTIVISAGTHEETVWAEVTDNGIGIPESDIPRLFERFYRVDKARSRERGGTGLGLAIAKEIVDMHGGRISVKSAPGHGTAIRVELPVNGMDGGEAPQ